MKIILILNLFLIAISTTTLATGTVDISGSGNAIYKNNSFVLLDFYEAFADQKPYFEPNYSEHTPSQFKLLKAWENRINENFELQHDLALNKKIASKMASIQNLDPILAFTLFEALKMYNWSLVDSPIQVIRNSETVIQGETVYQLAIRNDRTIYIAQPIWKQMALDQQVGLIFHEIISSLLPKMSALRERQIVSYFFSKSFLESSNEVQMKKLEQLLPCQSHFFKMKISNLLKTKFDHRIVPIPEMIKRISWAERPLQHGGQLNFLPFAVTAIEETQYNILGIQKKSMYSTLSLYNSITKFNLSLPNSANPKYKLKVQFEDWYYLSFKLNFKESASLDRSEPKLDFQMFVDQYSTINSFNSAGCLSVFQCKNKSDGEGFMTIEWLKEFKEY